MSVFTTLKKGNLRSLSSNFSKNQIKIKIDSKGRISIPSFLRKNLNLNEKSDISLVFDLRKNYFSIIVQNAPPFFRKESGKLSQRNYFTKDKVIVQNGVIGSTQACEAFSSSSNLDSGPVKLKRRVYER